MTMARAKLGLLWILRALLGEFSRDGRKRRFTRKANGIGALLGFTARRRNRKPKPIDNPKSKRGKRWKR